MKRSRSRSRSRVSPATLFFFLLSVALGIALYVKTRPPVREERPAPRTLPSPRPRAIVPARPRLLPSPLPPRSVSAGPEPSLRVAILIDDLGNDSMAVGRIAAWPFHVAGAVLPELSGSTKAAQELAASGKEVLLHLPMEPEGYPSVRPGPGVLLRAQNDGEVAKTLERDLASVPGAVGVNNHMGSAATADPRLMRVVARVLARHGLFFVDSRTTTATVAEQIAREEGVPSVSRHVFLDDVATQEAVEKAFAGLLTRVRADGSALAIGHPHPATLSVLERELPKLEQEGVRLVRIGELVQ